MYFLSIIFIFVSQTILFGQNNCEDLTQNECNETLTCTWSIVSSPNGFFEMCVEEYSDMWVCSDINNIEECFAMDCNWEYSNNTPSGGVCVENDNAEHECREYENQDECLEAGCQWNDNECVEINNEENDEHTPPSCLMDCNIENVNIEQNPFDTCDWMISSFNSNNTINPCTQDCDNDIIMEIGEFIEICLECLTNNNCDEIFSEENNDNGSQDECREYQSQDECLEAGCQWNNNECIEEYSDIWVCSDISNIEECFAMDCNWEYSNNTPLGGVCVENDNAEHECREYENQDECLEAGCQWNNNECVEINNEENGVLYGFVEYVWGDAIGMVPNARIQAELIYSDIIIETYTDESGAYELSLPFGSYLITASAYENSHSTGITIESNQEYELNFELGEWNFNEFETIFSLGHGTGTQDGFTVPLFLETDVPVSGLQFAVLPEFNGQGYYFNPSEIESVNDCFSANFNDVYGQLWGIIFSLEGCIYSPGEHHVANLSFSVPEGINISPGTEVNLIFTYTLASDPNANEISSSSQGAVVTFGTLGDVNSDTFINVVDIVNMVNFALQIEIPTEFEFWSSDLNQDGNINILDVVSVVNMILYGSDMQRSDSQNATVYFNEKEIHIHGKDIAGFQIEFLDHFEIDNIIIPDSWLFDINKKTIIVYNVDGMLLNDKSVLKLDKANSITNIIVSNAQGNAMTVNLGSIPHSVHLR